MYTDDVEDEDDEDEDPAGPAADPDGVLSNADTEGRPLLPLTGVPLTSSSHSQSSQPQHSGAQTPPQVSSAGPHLD